MSYLTRRGPVFMALVAIGLLSIMDGVIKHATLSSAIVQVVFFRYLFGTMSAFAVFLASGTPWPNLATIRPHAWRGLMVCITAVTFFYALSVLPLAVALALSFTAPILIALLARIHLKEKPSSFVALALALGFAGVLVVLSGELDRSGETSWFGIVAALVSAVSYAISMVALKSRAARDPVPTIVLLQNTIACLLVVPLVVPFFSVPTSGEVGVYAVIGLLGTGGHLAMAWAYGRADASRLSALEYIAFVWAAGIGLVFFHEIPSLHTMAGAALIVAGAWLAAREKKPGPAVAPEVEIGP